MVTGRLEAEGTKWHGVEVQPVSIGAIKDGVGMILVEHPDFIGGRASIPICRGSCYPDRPRKYGMTYRGTPHDIRRYGGFSGRPKEILAQRDADLSFLDKRNRSFRPNSPGPDIHLLHQANIPISPWGRVGHAHPPNITGNPAGHNTDLFRNKQDVANALTELGYHWEGDRKFEFSRAIRQFQGDWNKISNSIPAKRDLQNINWVRVPRGNVVPDGMAGPVTQNALEIALVNQRAGLPWEKILLINEHAERGYPKREHVYDARQRDIGRRHIEPPVDGTGISRRK